MATIAESSARVSQSGTSVEAIMKQHASGSSGATAVTFDQASVGGAAARLFSCGHVRATPQQYSNSVATFVPRWHESGGAMLVAACRQSMQGFEIVDKTFANVLRSGYYAGGAGGAGGAAAARLSAIIDVCVLPHDVLCAVHVDCTVTFWSLPGLSYRSSISHAAEIDAANTNKKQQQQRRRAAHSADDDGIVLFKVVPPCSSTGGGMPHRAAWTGAALVTGTRDGRLVPWSNGAAADVVERFAPQFGAALHVCNQAVTSITPIAQQHHLHGNKHAAHLVAVTSMDRFLSFVEVSSGGGGGLSQSPSSPRSPTTTTATGSSSSSWRLTLIAQRSPGSRHLRSTMLLTTWHTAAITCSAFIPTSIIPSQQQQQQPSALVSTSGLVATAGFDTAIYLSAVPTPSSSSSSSPASAAAAAASAAADDDAALAPICLSDPSNPHRDRVVSLFYIAGHLVSADAAGVVKVWDVRHGAASMLCTQTIEASRLGEDAAPPPLLLTGASAQQIVNRIAHAQKAAATQRAHSTHHLGDAQHASEIVSARTRRVFAGTSVASRSCPPRCGCCRRWACRRRLRVSAPRRKRRLRAK